MKKKKGIIKIIKAIIAIFICLLIFVSVGEQSKGLAMIEPVFSKPNMVVITTDDQDLSALWVMPNVQRLADQGITFANNFVSYSLCAPSRATFLTGQYAHNHGVLSNIFNGKQSGGYVMLDHTNTLPVWLQNAGYYTGHIGKYLNGYGIQDSPTVAGEPPYEVPAGWSEWYGTLDPWTYHYYGYFVNENGKIKYYGHSPEDYNTDVFANQALSFIQRAAKLSSPFFLSLNFLTPHAEWAGTTWQAPVPPYRYWGTFNQQPLPRPPSFNEKVVNDKPYFIQNQPLLSEEEIAQLENNYRRRLESLLAVDEAIGHIVRTLSHLGLLDQTIIFFTSDNGFLLGEHRIRGKILLYEESIQVPLVVGGGVVKQGLVYEELTVNIDLAPTMVELAGASAGRVIDGRSLVPLLRRKEVVWRNDFLLESFTAGRPFRGVRSQEWVYGEHYGGQGVIVDLELYDLPADQYQLLSLHRNPLYQPLIQQFQSRLAVLKSCHGQECW